MLQATKHFLEKLRALPQTDRLVIFGLVMVLAAILMGYWAFRSTLQSLPQISESVSALSIPSETTQKPSAQETPSPDPTSDWQTYVNTKAGFQIKYPENFSPTNYPKLVGVDFSEAIGLYVPKTDLSVADWISKKQVVPTQSTIGDQIVWQFSDAGVFHTVFSGQGRIVDVYSKDANSDIYKKMLLTFKFN